MLVLTRKPLESLVIDGDIEVVVLEVRGNRVMLGVKADRAVPVCRAELIDDTCERTENLYEVLGRMEQDDDP